MKPPRKSGVFVNLADKVTTPVMQHTNGIDHSPHWEPTDLGPVLAAIGLGNDMLLGIGEASLDLGQEMTDTISKINAKQDVLLRGLEAKYLETGEQISKIRQHLHITEKHFETSISKSFTDTELTLRKLLHTEIGYITGAVGTITAKLQMLVYILIAMQILQAVVVWISRR